ncbi:MAG: aminomethyl-transferring glycine dehydrogenase subunit GcvPB [Firmicutes bacterium]|nr:aminomethyl-transferring glycine dehydrogenase subunit GcvPB [Bacillota bacterium]
MSGPAEKAQAPQAWGPQGRPAAEEPLIFELSHPGRQAVTLPACDVPQQPLAEFIPRGSLRAEEQAPRLPEVAEVDLVRHYVRLSQRNHGVDVGFYPLGSCTMKYNPKVNEDAARLEGFSQIHPYQPEETVQGALELMYRLEDYLCEITGMDRFTLQPAAGAHGELTGLLIIRAYLADRGELGHRNKVIVPDSAHGTNPASAAVAGFQVVTVPSDARGGVDVEALRRVAGHDTAALMLTNPNTLGLFDENIVAISRIIHEAGGLVYYDGANLNAIMGYSRPGDMGFDAVHVNLHKTFSTPHGGGGPGAGPVGVKQFLAPYLPLPLVKREGGRYHLDWDAPKSIGRMREFSGSFGVLLRAYAYIRAMGPDGLKQASTDAVLNANYLLALLRPLFDVPYDRPCKHEFVVSGKNLKEYGIRTLDVAKRLLDYGFHAPTVYFPLIVEEALMVEPTETESEQTLRAFAQALAQIVEEARTDPEILRSAPHTLPVGRLDEAGAARHPVLRWHPQAEGGGEEGPARAGAPAPQAGSGSAKGSACL